MDVVIIVGFHPSAFKLLVYCMHGVWYMHKRSCAKSMIPIRLLSLDTVKLIYVCPLTLYALFHPSSLSYGGW